MKDLIKESDLILQGWVTEVHGAVDDEVHREASGYAVLVISQVLKGSYESRTLTIWFWSEAHEQRIDSLGDRLLFLRKADKGVNKGGYTGTHYGRSYWPLEIVLGTKMQESVTPYIYPITLVLVPQELVKDAEVRGEDQHGHRIRGIYLKDIVTLLKSQQTSEPK